jgi:hypothetical protein
VDVEMRNPIKIMIKPTNSYSTGRLSTNDLLEVTRCMQLPTITLKKDTIYMRIVFLGVYELNHLFLLISDVQDE